MNGPSAAMEARRLRDRARLLEFLKFRVLASQEAFFDAWRVGADGDASAQAPAPASELPKPHRSGDGSLPELDLSGFRQWLQPLWPPARDLSDADLHHALEQAHRLYIDPPPGRRP